jgi:hypothetical protein
VRDRHLRSRRASSVRSCETVTTSFGLCCSAAQAGVLHRRLTLIASASAAAACPVFICLSYTTEPAKEFPRFWRNLSPAARQEPCTLPAGSLKFQVLPDVLILRSHRLHLIT